MYEAPSVKRAFQILDLVARQDNSLTISDLSRELGISKSTVHGIAQALEGIGAVVRNGETKCYTLGMTLLQLAHTAYARLDLKDVARPVMEDLMRSTRQTVFLGIRAGDRVSIIDTVESTEDLKITAHIGARIPLMVGATGKVFMAALPEAEVKQMIRAVGLRQNTEKSITDSDQYLEEIRRVRKDGYAIDHGEYLQGVKAVAAPMYVPGRQMCAIWVVGFSRSMKTEKMTAMAVETKRAAEAISQKLDHGRPGK